ncbi:hypothetical protein DS837_21440 [Azospirillum brasilense]|uniref:Uncharacterized protein n=1 Tax=Azospirillum brasilense TaxID=192 RepID=A0A6L3AW55_AZOBR|nr:hypothetical protein DS837_21440 [Azospirillum brasilense]
MIFLFGAGRRCPLPGPPPLRRGGCLSPPLRSGGGLGWGPVATTCAGHPGKEALNRRPVGRPAAPARP